MHDGSFFFFLAVLLPADFSLCAGSGNVNINVIAWRGMDTMVKCSARWWSLAWKLFVWCSWSKRDFHRVMIRITVRMDLKIFLIEARMLNYFFTWNLDSRPTGLKKTKKKPQHILIKANQITFKHWWRKITSPTSSTPRLSSINLCPHFSLPVLLSSSLSMLFFFLTSPSLLLLLLFLHSNRDDVKYRRNNASYPTAGKLSNNSNINLTNSIQLPGPAWY